LANKKVAVKLSIYALSTGVTLFLIYSIYTFFTWGNYNEVKTIRIEAKNYNEFQNRNDSVVTILDSGNEKVEVVRNHVTYLYEHECYIATIQGISSPFQVRWMISDKSTPCPK
jgi:hypothetical protein